MGAPSRMRSQLFMGTPGRLSLMSLAVSIARGIVE